MHARADRLVVLGLALAERCALARGTTAGASCDSVIPPLSNMGTLRISTPYGRENEENTHKTNAALFVYSPHYTPVTQKPSKGYVSVMIYVGFQE